MQEMKWTCLQLGSREHYAIPRALRLDQSLECLLTDVWVPQGNGFEVLLGKFKPAFSQRRHDAIPDQLVQSNSLGLLAHELIAAKFCGKAGWELILSRNRWFQEWALRQLDGTLLGSTDVLFSYSYTAAQPFRCARKAACKKILGQIDPGPLHYDWVAEKTAAYRHLEYPGQSPPKEYWEAWRDEIDMSDRILVNSAWSAKLLTDAGVPAAKLTEIPLAYEAPAPEMTAMEMSRTSKAESFTPSRPLRILFLGQVTLTKGIGQFFDAIRMLSGASIEFTFAGHIGVRIPDDLRGAPHIRFLGPVDRRRCRELYAACDMFILPTLSDGFAITQLEAQAQGVPVLASPYCGQVVDHGQNGWLLKEVSPEAIAAAVESILLHPDEIARITANCRVAHRFTLEALRSNLSLLSRSIVGG